MNPRDFLSFFRTKSGKLLLFVIVFAGALLIFSAIRKHQPGDGDDVATVTKSTTNHSDKPQVVQTVQRAMEAFHPPPPNRNRRRSLLRQIGHRHLHLRRSCRQHNTTSPNHSRPSVSSAMRLPALPSRNRSVPHTHRLAG